MLARPTLADPEVAAATFSSHLTQLWNSQRHAEKGWGIVKLDPLHAVVALPATRPDGTRDWYFVKLGAEYYDASPPTVALVDPANWSAAKESTRWFPTIASAPPWFGLHATYTYPDGTIRQLVCFTFTAEYYMVDHSPPPTALWQQGRHTLAATLNRLSEVLGPPYYQRPAG